jgi:para-aminobenzoate synthetase component 1
MPLPFRFQPRVEPLTGAAGALPLGELAARLGPGPLVLLEGWPQGVSVLGFAPLPAPLPRSLLGLRALLARLAPAGGDPVPGAFHGGFLGALAYELGAAAERGLVLPADPWGLPRLVGGLFCDFLVRDEARGTTTLVLGEEPGDGRAPVAQRARELAARLARPALLAPCRPRAELVRLVPRAEHARRIERARTLIGEGEIYQANLTHRFEREVGGDPLELWLRLVRLHPAPYAGFLRWARGALLSVSPELLLEFAPDADGPRARTRPIKGTAPRASDAAEDRASAAALLASVKDRSELAMIVDLERNDLGRIARPGGVEVHGFPSLESYASVHHLAADVVARPRAGIDALACLAALFPGGSVTGAPKLRSMEVIAELEGEGRGFAYGSLLALDTRGVLTANLLIRTLIWRPRPGPEGAGQVGFRVGGGITWGSDAAAEEAEAEAKGARLAHALEGADAPSL